LFFWAVLIGLVATDIKKNGLRKGK